MLLFFRFRELFLFLLSSEDNRVAELESTLEEVKIQRDLAKREENEQSSRCKALETQAKELKTKLQSSELEVNELLLKCENLEAELQQLRTAGRDANLENSSQLDQRSNKAEGQWARGPRPLFLDQTEARRAEKKFFWDRAHPPPIPLSEGLNPPLRSLSVI